MKRICHEIGRQCKTLTRVGIYCHTECLLEEHKFVFVVLMEDHLQDYAITS